MSPPKVFEFTLATENFDLSLIPSNASERGTPAFREAVKAHLQNEFKQFGGWNEVEVDDRLIKVSWTPDGQAPNELDQIVAKLQRGERAGVITLLQLLLSDRPNDVALNYNLGMALSDVGRLDEAKTHLRHTLQLAPEFTNARVALGVALHRQGKANEALQELREAVKRSPENPWAHMNLGSCLLNLGFSGEGIECLCRATELNPRDQQAWFSLGKAREASGTAAADTAYRNVIDIDEYSSLADAAREALSRIARVKFRDVGGGSERPDAVLYCLDAIERFENMVPADVQLISVEIALLGQRGLDVNDSAKKYELKNLPGSFSGLHLVCLMYVGFKQLRPEHDVGFDLSREYAAAKSLYADRRSGR